MQKVLLHCQISRELRLKLGEAVDTLGKTTSELVEEALSFYLDSTSEEKKEPATKKKTKKASKKAD